jgi:hypothetical protein
MFEDETYVFRPEIARDRARYMLTQDTDRDTRTQAFQTIELYEWAMVRLAEVGNERH